MTFQSVINKIIRKLLSLFCVFAFHATQTVLICHKLVKLTNYGCQQEKTLIHVSVESMLRFLQPVRGKKGKKIIAGLSAGWAAQFCGNTKTFTKLQASSGWMNVVALGCKSDGGRSFVVPSRLSGSCLFHFHCQLCTVHCALLITSALVRLPPCPRIITPAAAATKAGELLQDLTSPGLYFIARCLIHF